MENNFIDERTFVRTVQQIRVKIGEAKNLPARTGLLPGLRDVYVYVSLDRERIFKTSTIPNTLDPFFGEEFQFEIPRTFRHLSFYIYDKDSRAVNNRDKILGKVAIKKDELSQYHGKDNWFPIKPVDNDSEVQGKVNVDVRLENVFTSSKPGSPPQQKLAVRIIECNDLAIVNGSCDPFAVVNLHRRGQDRPETSSKRTKTQKKSNCPQFDDVFHFDIPIRPHHSEKAMKVSHGTIDNMELRVSIMHDSNGVWPGSVFLGEVRIPLTNMDLTKGKNAWYLLQPREPRADTKTGLGSLRLKIHYSSDSVFSGQFYEPLRSLILESPDIKPITSSAIYILGEIVSNKSDAAQPLVKLLVHYKKIVPCIKALAEWEISKVTDVNTIFRGNSLVSKCMDELMKLIGIKYLHETLRGVIEQIITERKPCEIDRSRMNEGENLDQNVTNLKGYIEKAFNAITNSAFSCPSIMCEVFAALKDLALSYFPDSPHVCYNVISGFVFLRFFAPAILNPKLFEIIDQPIDAQTNRTLTLISKAVQSIGNLCKKVIIKEDYTQVLYKDLLNEKYAEETKIFLKLISTYPTTSIMPPRPHSSIVLKESMMTKRAQGRNKRLGWLRNFKKRYFCLTTEEFYYAKSRNGQPLCRIPIAEILAVEKLNFQSFKKGNMFQVVRKDASGQAKVLYIQANNCVEFKEWIDILTKVCQTNRHRLMEYHPAAFIAGQWQCCRSMDEAAPGCCPVTPTSIPLDIHVNIDPDREMQQIHSQFFKHMDLIETLIDACQNPHKINQLSRNEKLPNFVIEDRHTLWQTLQRIHTYVRKLESFHKQYLRRKYRALPYGSQEAPIGDDNYLLMVKKHCSPTTA